MLDHWVLLSRWWRSFGDFLPFCMWLGCARVTYTFSMDMVSRINFVLRRIWACLLLGVLIIWRNNMCLLAEQTLFSCMLCCSKRSCMTKHEIPFFFSDARMYLPSIGNSLATVFHSDDDWWLVTSVCGSIRSTHRQTCEMFFATTTFPQ